MCYPVGHVAPRGSHLDYQDISLKYRQIQGQVWRRHIGEGKLIAETYDNVGILQYRG
jgi:hypothetical protein